MSNLRSRYPLLLLAGSFAALIMLTIFAMLQFREYEQQTNYVEHSYKVMYSLEELKENFVAEAMFRRGYAIFPTSTGAQKIAESRDSTFSTLNKLGRLVEDNPDQSKKVQRLRELISGPEMNINRWPVYQDISDTTQRVNSIRKDIIHNIVFQEFDSVYVVMNSIVSEEEVLFARRSAIQHQSARNTPLMFAVLTVVALAILLFAFLRIQKDLFRRIGLQRQLEKMVQDLQQKNKEQERFAFVSAHHLREPIRKAMLFLSRLSHGQSLPPDQAKLLERASVNISVLDRLTQDLSLYSSILAEKSAPESVDLNTVWQLAQGDLKTESAKRHANIKTNGTLPVITGYSERIRYVFREILTNTLKFHQPGQAPDIELSSERDENTGEWLIHFQDKGIGFAQQHAERIFNVFEQLHSPDQFEGTGMGLALCHRIMQMHQGKITAQSVENQGTVFTLHFPAQA